jgi:hypothetical protein
MAKSWAPSSTVRFLIAVLLGAGLVACGGDDDDDDAGDGGPDAGPGACTEAPCLAPPEDGAGFQVKLAGQMIDPGQEVELCQIVALPGGPDDTYYVNRFESEMALGSHHLIVAAIVPGSDTDADAEVGDVRECFGPGGFSGGIGFGGGDLISVTGQQLPRHEETFPEGVGRVYTGGQKLIFNYHYFNATEDPLEVRAALNFYTMDPAKLERIAAEFSAIFVGIFVPQGEKASFDVECLADSDIMVHKLIRHTHQWGTDFPVSFAGGERDGELIYTSPNYEDPDYTFPEPVLVKAGEGFRFTCNYDNTDGDHDLTFGETTKNEMCILFATIYSPDTLDVSGQGCFGFDG